MTKWNRSISSDTYDSVKPLTTEMGSAYRPPTYKWSVPYPKWTDDASCNSLSPKLFELADEADTDEQHELIAQGLRVCVGCPVRAACLADSNEEDRYWSTRGGQPPGGLFEGAKKPKITLYRLPGGYKSGEGPTVQLQAKCNKGHEDYVIEASGIRRCATCRRESANAARKKRSGRRDIDWNGKAV